MTQHKTPARAVRYNADASRIQRGDEIVAMALKLTNGRWGLYDCNEQKLTPTTYKSARDVAAAFNKLDMGATQ